MTCQELVNLIENKASFLDINKFILSKGVSLGSPVHIAVNVPDSMYNYCLASVGTILKIQNVLELGTRAGASAMCISMNCKSVTTCDIDWEVLDKNITNRLILPAGAPIPLHIEPGILAVKFKDGDDCLRCNFNKYDFIFVDIGDHEGLYELEIHHKLLEQNYQGFVFYDDVRWGGMQKMWEQVYCDKIDTNWHLSSGFGVVKYG